MSAPLYAALWALVLAAGLGACVVLRRAGLATTHVRDLLHVGAGVWVLGWPLWPGPAVPVAITAIAAAGVWLLPRWGRRLPILQGFVQSISDADERWSGIVLYTVSFAVMTALGLARAPFPAAAALWALCLGDGIGGAVGKRFGAHHYRIPGSKPKSIEGSVAAAIAASAGVAGAAAWFHAAVAISIVAAAGAVAAVAEALSPRASDNVVVPAAVWAFLSVAT
jgi:dolichol kinase